MRCKFIYNPKERFMIHKKFNIIANNIEFLCRFAQNKVIKI